MSGLKGFGTSMITQCELCHGWIEYNDMLRKKVWRYHMHTIANLRDWFVLPKLFQILVKYNIELAYKDIALASWTYANGTNSAVTWERERKIMTYVCIKGHSCLICLRWKGNWPENWEWTVIDIDWSLKYFQNTIVGLQIRLSIAFHTLCLFRRVLCSCLFFPRVLISLSVCYSNKSSHSCWFKQLLHCTLFWFCVQEDCTCVHETRCTKCLCCAPKTL